MAKHLHPPQDIKSGPFRQGERYEVNNCLLPELGMLGWTLFSEAKMHGLESHRHEGAYEICYIVGGNTTWWVGDEIFEVQPGDIFITWPDEPHGGVDGIMHPCELYWLQVVMPPGDGCMLGLNETESNFLRESYQSLPCRCFPGDRKLSWHFERMLYEHRVATPMSAAAVRASLQLLLLGIIREVRERESGQGGRRQYSERIAKSIQWLTANLGQQVGVEDMAAHVGLRPSQFRSQFRKETGFSPIEFVTRLRVREAKRLLVANRLSITEIAFELGFSSSQYFATSFRRLTGLTPREFRKFPNRRPG